MQVAAPRRTSKKRLFFFLILALILAAALFWILQPYSVETNSGGRHGKNAANATTPVVAAAAHKGDIGVTLKGLGTVTPLANVTVRTQINGLLEQLAFQEGQMVQQGDFIAQIDPRPYQLALEQAEGAYQRDLALLKEAQLNLERYKKLVAQDSIAKQQVDTQESLVGQYQGTVLTDQGQIDASKLNLIYCHITAPITGRIGIRQVDQGNYVQVGDAAGIVTITELSPITVIFTLPEDNLPSIMKELAAGSELQVTAYDRTEANKLAVGKLVSVDNQIDTSTGTIKIRAQFDNQDLSLFPNQFVNVELLVSTLKNVEVIPSAGVQRGAPGTFVYLIKDDQTVTIKPVTLGPTEGDNVAVTEGLNDGDKIVIDGADKLREGAKISLPDASQDGQGSAAPDADGKSDPAKSDGSKPDHKHSKKNQ